MLEYLYDLPEEEEQRALQEHLQGCPTCPALWREAREQQRLLAAAARLAFPGVRFEPPAEAAVNGRDILALPNKPTSTRWVPWAVAAGLLLAVGGLGVPLLRSWKSTEPQVGGVDEKKDGATVGGPAGGVPSSKSEPRRFAPASVREIAAWVEVLDVNPESRTIEVRTRRGQTRRLSLSPNGRVVLRGSEGSLADLRAGQTVLLTLEEDSKGQWSNLKKVEDEATARAAGKAP